jgi:hypothetical protein
LLRGGGPARELDLPFVVTYTTVIYWVFRGKVQVGKFSY